MKKLMSFGLAIASIVVVGCSGPATQESDLAPGQPATQTIDPQTGRPAQGPAAPGLD